MGKRFGRLRPMTRYLLTNFSIGVFFWLLGTAVLTLLLKIQVTYFKVVVDVSPAWIYPSVGLVVLLSIALLYFERLFATIGLVKRGVPWKEAEFAVFRHSLHRYYHFERMPLSEVRDQIASWR